MPWYVFRTSASQIQRHCFVTRPFKYLEQEWASDTRLLWELIPMFMGTWTGYFFGYVYWRWDEQKTYFPVFSICYPDFLWFSELRRGGLGGFTHFTSEWLLVAGQQHGFVIRRRRLRLYDPRQRARFSKGRVNRGFVVHAVNCSETVDSNGTRTKSYWKWPYGP